MNAEIKDKQHLVRAGLRAVGFNINQKGVELMLNISDFVRKNPDATLKDITEQEQRVLELFKQSELTRLEGNNEQIDKDSSTNDEEHSDKVKKKSADKVYLFELQSSDFDWEGSKSEKINWTTVRLHEQLRDRIGHYKTMKKATLEEWRDSIRLMYEQDDLSFDQIWTYLEFAMSDNFWKDTIKSTSGLRNNWEQIDQSIRKNKNNNGQPKRRPSQDGFDKEKAKRDLAGLQFED